MVLYYFSFETCTLPKLFKTHCIVPYLLHEIKHYIKKTVEILSESFHIRWWCSKFSFAFQWLPEPSNTLRLHTKLLRWFDEYGQTVVENKMPENGTIPQIKAKGFLLTNKARICSLLVKDIIIQELSSCLASPSREWSSDDKRKHQTLI